MKTNNLLYVCGFVAITLILITGGYLILKDSDELGDRILTNDSTDPPVDMTEKAKETAKRTSFTMLKHNVEPQFDVGDRFEYEIQGIIIGKGNDNLNAKGKLECSVEKMDRIEGEDCYLLISNKETHIPNIDGPSNIQLTKNEERIMFLERKDCIHKNTGKILKTFIQQGTLREGMKIGGTPTEATIPTETSEVYGNIMYYPWMLALDDNFEMEVNKTYDMGDLSEGYVSVFKVIGREKVNDRDCFKTEMRMIDKNNRVRLRENIWIDVEKRILVKSETYDENLKLSEINLVSKR